MLLTDITEGNKFLTDLARSLIGNPWPIVNTPFKVDVDYKLPIGEFLGQHYDDVLKVAEGLRRSRFTEDLTGATGYVKLLHSTSALCMIQEGIDPKCVHRKLNDVNGVVQINACFAGVRELVVFCKDRISMLGSSSDIMALGSLVGGTDDPSWTYPIVSSYGDGSVQLSWHGFGGRAGHWASSSNFYLVRCHEDGTLSGVPEDDDQ